MNAALLRVMYSPLDYIHPELFPAPQSRLPATLRAALNHMLIQRFALPVNLDFEPAAQDFSETIISKWHHLPQVARLLGYKLMRASLARSGGYAALPVPVRRFIALPVSCQSLDGDINPSPAQIEQCGVNYLMALQPVLPAPLAARLPLLFAPAVRSVVADGPPNRTLLACAFDYATYSSY